MLYKVSLYFVILEIVLTLITDADTFVIVVRTVAITFAVINSDDVYLLFDVNNHTLSLGNLIRILINNDTLISEITVALFTV